MTSHFIFISFFFFFTFSHRFPSRAALWSEDHVYTESLLREGTGRALLEEKVGCWKPGAGSTHRLKVKQILHGCSVHYSGHMGRLRMRPAWYMYIFGVCVCVSVSTCQAHTGLGFITVLHQCLGIM